jgi:hypothetical protein
MYGVLRGEVATPFISVATSIALVVTAILLFVPYREGHGVRQPVHRRPAHRHRPRHLC